MADIEVETEVTGNVWKVLCQVGDRVETEQELVILESMKMEIPVEAPQAGPVKALNVGEGDAVDEGQIILVLEG
ncbi:MAG: biotin/lipoyl-binding carrier protein [Gammaproteobacteria bacterium]